MKISFSKKSVPLLPVPPLTGKARFYIGALLGSEALATALRNTAGSYPQG
jgi:hypothetical protein